MYSVHKIATHHLINPRMSAVLSARHGRWVCTGGEHEDLEIPMDWWPSPKDWPWFYASFAHGIPWHILIQLPAFHGWKIFNYSICFETCWNHRQQHCWYSYIRLWPDFTTTPAQSCAQKQLACSGWNLHRVPPPQRLSWQLAKSTTMGFSTDATYTAANKDNKEQKQQSVYSVDV